MKTQNTSSVQSLFNRTTQLLFISGVLSVSLLTIQNTYADNLYGETCGPELTCSGTETCQVRFRDILPITEINPILQDNEEGFAVRYQCVDAPQLRAPNSVYRGPQRPDGYNTVIPRGTAGVPVNLINVQDPIPVDIFNPNPVPTNIVSPTPLPVVVVDDLAMYHQTKIDEAQNQLAKSRAQEQTMETVAEKINEENLMPANPWQAGMLAVVQSAIQNPTTGTVPMMLERLADSSYDVNSIAARVEEIFNSEQDPQDTQWIRAHEEFKVKFAEECPNVDFNTAGQHSFYCMHLAMEFSPESLSMRIIEETERKLAQAKEAQEFNFNYPTRDVTEDGSQNPLTKEIITPAKFVEEMAVKALLDIPFERLVANSPCSAYAVAPIQDIVDNFTRRGAISNIVNNVTQDEAGSIIPLGFENRVTRSILDTAQCELDNSLGDGIIGNIFRDVIGPELRAMIESPSGETT